MSDLTFAFRQLRKNLGFTAVAVLTLGLGIGMNTALFSVINAFLLRPLAVAEPQRLVGVYNGSKKNPDDWRGFSYARYLDVRNRNEVFADVLAHQTTQTLQQELPENAAACTAQGEPDGNLPAPRLRSRQHHVAKIHANDDQDDSREQHQHGGECRHAERVADRPNVQGEPW